VKSALVAEAPLTIRGATLLSAEPGQTPPVVDVVIQAGRISAIADSGKSAKSDGGTQVIDARGMLLMPGLVDMHVHLREPGQTHKETLHSGTLAAARGGFTFVACMPNTRPVLDEPDELRTLRRRIEDEALIDVGIIAAVTRGQHGEELTDFAALKAAGALALSDDGRGIQRASVMRAALKRGAELGLPIFAHCEDESLSHGGVIHEGQAALDRCLVGIPAESESAHVARDIVLAEASGARYHVCHLSCAQSLRLVREAKARGQAVTCEVTPHHLLLADSDIVGDDGNYKMNPPLRTAADREALIAGLIDGTVDAIATDHAPHTASEKARGLAASPFGVIGLETAFPLLYTHLVESGRLPLARLVELLTVGPARLLGIRRPRLAVGEVAELTLVDVRRERPIADAELRSKSRNTPFLNRVVRGWPVLTLGRGRVAYQDALS
jgi:dihydroorotase